MLLAIDTSTHYASVAVHDGSQLLAEHTWLAKQDHTRTLLPAIRTVLSAAGTTLDAVTAVAVALGPGSFNGLRVGLSTAKGLALARHLPLVGVPTLELLAAEYGLAQPTMNAGRGRVYRTSTEYPMPSTGYPVPSSEYPVPSAETPSAETPSAETPGAETPGSEIPGSETPGAGMPGAGMAGAEMAGAEMAGAEMAGAEMAGAEMPSVETPSAEMAGGADIELVDGEAPDRVRHASVLAELGWRRLRAGLVLDAAKVQPLYVQAPHITPSRKVTGEGSVQPVRATDPAASGPPAKVIPQEAEGDSSLDAQNDRDGAHLASLQVGTPTLGTRHSALGSPETVLR